MLVHAWEISLGRHCCLWLDVLQFLETHSLHLNDWGWCATGPVGRQENVKVVGEGQGPGAGVDLEALEDQELGGRGGSSTRVWHSMKQRNWWKGEVNQVGHGNPSGDLFTLLLCAIFCIARKADVWAALAEASPADMVQEVCWNATLAMAPKEILWQHLRRCNGLQNTRRPQH